MGKFIPLLCVKRWLVPSSMEARVKLWRFQSINLNFLFFCNSCRCCGRMRESHSLYFEFWQDRSVLFEIWIRLCKSNNLKRKLIAAVVFSHVFFLEENALELLQKAFNWRHRVRAEIWSIENAHSIFSWKLCGWFRIIFWPVNKFRLKFIRTLLWT